MMIFFTDEITDEASSQVKCGDDDGTRKEVE